MQDTRQIAEGQAVGREQVHQRLVPRHAELARAREREERMRGAGSGRAGGREGGGDCKP